MKKKLLSFVIAAAMVMGIPAALGSAGLNMPDEVTVAPVTANAKTTTSSIGSTRNSSTKATVSAYGSFDRKAKRQYVQYYFKKNIMDLGEALRDSQRNLTQRLYIKRIQ